MSIPTPAFGFPENFLRPYPLNDLEFIKDMLGPATIGLKNHTGNQDKVFEKVRKHHPKEPGCADLSDGCLDLLRARLAITFDFMARNPQLWQNLPGQAENVTLRIQAFLNWGPILTKDIKVERAVAYQMLTETATANTPPVDMVRNILKVWATLPLHTYLDADNTIKANINRFDDWFLPTKNPQVCKWLTKMNGPRDSGRTLKPYRFTPKQLDMIQLFLEQGNFCQPLVIRLAEDLDLEKPLTSMDTLSSKLRNAVPDKRNKIETPVPQWAQLNNQLNTLLPIVQGIAAQYDKGLLDINLKAGPRVRSKNPVVQDTKPSPVLTTQGHPRTAVIETILVKRGPNHKGDLLTQEALESLVELWRTAYPGSQVRLDDQGIVIQVPADHTFLNSLNKIKPISMGFSIGLTSSVPSVDKVLGR